MLWAVTLLSVWLALAAAIPSRYMAGITLALLAIMAHFAGAAIGHHFHRPRHAKGLAPRLHPLDSQHFAPQTHLSQIKSLPFLVLILAIGAGIFGAVAAVITTSQMTQNRVGIPGLAVAGITFGGLTGLGTFLMIGFWQVVWAAWTQAVDKTSTYEGSGHNPGSSSHSDSDPNPST